MATGGSLSSISAQDQDFRYACTLCMGPYRGRNPKLLPCFHSFCLPCLTTLEASATAEVTETLTNQTCSGEFDIDDGVTGGSGNGTGSGDDVTGGDDVRSGSEKKIFYCPTCRAVVTVPDGGVEFLQSNFYINHETNEEEATSQALCDRCDDGNPQAASFTCQDCPSNMCRTCRRYHDKFMADHHVTSLALGQPAAGERKRREMCLVHRDQPLCFHCRHCQVSICVHCKVSSSHEGHDTVPLESEISRAKEDVSALVTAAQHQIPALQSTLNQLGRKERQLTRDTQEVKQQVHARYQQLVTWASQSRDQLLESLCGKEDAVTTNLQKEKITMTTTLDKLDALVSQASTRTGNDPAFISLRKDLKSTLLTQDQLSNFQQESNAQSSVWPWKYDTTNANSVLGAQDVVAFMGDLVEEDSSAVAKRVSLQKLTDMVDHLYTDLAERSSNLSSQIQACKVEVTSVKQKEADLEKSVALLNTDVSGMKKDEADLRQRADAVDKEVDSLKKMAQVLQDKADKAGTNIAFQARSSKEPFQVAQGSILILDLVITNIGDHYNIHSGVFTAPVPGTYAFHVTCMGTIPSNIGVSVIANDVVVTQAWSASRATSELGSSYVIVHLKSGERVWARAEQTVSMRGLFWTTFGGHLIRADV